MPLAVLVDVIKLRWRIERDYQELKSELGSFRRARLRGFHHHASLAIAAYGFRILERSAFPPSPLAPRKPALSGRARSSRTPIRPERHVAKRVAFLRSIIEADVVNGLTPAPTDEWPRQQVSAASEGDYKLIYLGERQPAIWAAGLQTDDRDYQIDVIDAWNTTIVPAKRVPCPVFPRIRQRGLTCYRQSNPSQPRHR
jgi:hypothetical protein